MRSKKAPLSLIVIGSLLALGPLWGLLGTAIGMIRAFRTLNAAGTADPEQLAAGVRVALGSTAAGIIASPIGLALLIGGIIWLVRINRHEPIESSVAECLPPAAAPPPP